jgi:hypothetical protein
MPPIGEVSSPLQHQTVPLPDFRHRGHWRDTAHTYRRIDKEGKFPTEWDK